MLTPRLGGTRARRHPRGLREGMSNKSVININCLSFLGPTTPHGQDFKQPIKGDGDSALAPNGLLLNTSKGAAALPNAHTLKKHLVLKKFKSKGPKLSLNMT